MGKHGEKNALRNYLLLLMEGSMWQGFMTLLDPASVVALFLSTMTGSVSFAGLAMTVMAVMPMLGKIFCGPFTPRIRRLVRYTTILRLIRSASIIGLAIPLILNASNAVSVGVFFALFALFHFEDGMLEVPMGELRARVVSPHLRGHVTGMSLVTGGLLSLAAGVVLNYLLTAPMLDDNGRFAAIFLLAGTFLVAGSVFTVFIRDTSGESGATFSSLGRFYRMLPEMIRGDNALKLFLIAYIPGVFSEIILNFLIVFGSNELSLPDAQVSWLIMARIIGILFGGLVWGEISRRYGNKTVILSSQAGCGIVALSGLSAALFPALGIFFMVAVCFICGVMAPGWLGRVNYLLDIAPPARRSEYQVILSLAGLPFSFVGLLAGIVADTAGYPALFIGCTAFAVAAIVLSMRLLNRSQLERRRFETV